MSSSPGNSRGPLGERFERQMELERRRRSEADANQTQERIEAETGHIRNEVNTRFGPSDDLLQQTLNMSGRLEGPNARRRVDSGRVGTNSTRALRDQELSELPTTLTPPITPQSAFAPAESTLGPRDLSADTIEQLHLELQTEQRQRAQLERQLEEANRQIRQYEYQKDSISVQQEQAAVDDDQTKSARLERQIIDLRQLLQGSREEISRLQIELVRKDTMIADLRSELERRAGLIVTENGSSMMDHVVRTTSPASSRRLSVSYLSRNKASNEMYVKKGEKVMKVPDSQRPWVS